MAKAKGKGKGKMILFGVALLALCGVVTCGLLGIIQIPGLSPKKKVKVASLYGESMYNEGLLGTKKEAPIEPLKNPQTKPTKPVVQRPGPPKEDKVQGQKKLAKLWNEIEIDKLVPIVETWKDIELAPVLSRMAPEKAAELLAALKPERASKLSHQLQLEASKLTVMN